MTIALLRCVCVVMLLGGLGLVRASPLSAQAPVLVLAQLAAESVGDQLARALFDAAMDAYDAGKYADSLDLFEEAYAHCGRPAFLFDIGHVADRLRQDQKALDSFRAYLSALPDASNRGAVETRIAVISASLAERTPVRRAPTPQSAARAAKTFSAREVAAKAVSPVMPSAPPPHSDSPVRARKRWWLWTGVGAAVAAGVAAGLVVAFRPTPTHSEEPIQSANGIPAYRGP